MRLMSFALTTPQMLARTKTVTRRMGWADAEVGDVVQPIKKGQGLKKGETVTPIPCGPIRFTHVSREYLADITPQDVYREGFPHMTTREFVAMFTKHNGCRRYDKVTRIQFEFVDEAPR